MISPPSGPAQWHSMGAHEPLLSALTNYSKSFWVTEEHYWSRLLRFAINYIYRHQKSISDLLHPNIMTCCDNIIAYSPIINSEPTWNTKAIGKNHASSLLLQMISLYLFLHSHWHSSVSPKYLPWPFWSQMKKLNPWGSGFTSLLYFSLLYPTSHIVPGVVQGRRSHEQINTVPSSLRPTCVRHFCRKWPWCQTAREKINNRIIWTVSGNRIDYFWYCQCA